MVEKLTTIDESQYQIQFLWGLEGKLEGHDEGVVDLRKDGSLCQGMRDFGSRDDVGFSDSLEGVNSVGVFLPRDCKSWLYTSGIWYTYCTCMTLPKLPLPTTLRSSKSSIVRRS
jgi:hypothetical protein